MRKITMKTTGDAEFANQEHQDAERGGLQIDASPKHGKACQMNHYKQNAG
jgi:hypothetical protein